MNRFNSQFKCNKLTGLANSAANGDIKRVSKPD